VCGRGGKEWGMDGDQVSGDEQRERPARAALRLGTAERQQAVELLAGHQREGRLTAREYEDRSLAARSSVTWADIDALFTDLPQPHPHPADPPPAPLAATSTPVPATRPQSSSPSTTGSSCSPGRREIPEDGLIPRKLAVALSAIVVPVAMILFFTTWQWWWWLLIPIVNGLIYGRGWGRDRD